MRLPYWPDNRQYYACLRDLPWPVWLDSGFPQSGGGRYDIIAADPYVTLTCRSGVARVRPAAGDPVATDDDPLTVLRGLGVRTAPKLTRLGLETVADVRAMPLVSLRQWLGARQGTAIYQQARGLAEDRVEPGRARKSISKETTFPEDVTDPAVLRETLRWAAQEVGYVARHGGYQGTVVTLKVRFRGFETHTRSQTLSGPSAEDRTLFDTAWRLFETAGWGHRPVRLIGLGLSGWPETCDTAIQPDLFAETAPSDPSPIDPSTTAPSTKGARLTETLDAIRERFGAGVIQRGPGRRHP